MKYLIWLLAILFVVVVVLIVTGWGDKGYDALKKSLAEREIQENLENNMDEEIKQIKKYLTNVDHWKCLPTPRR